MINKPRTTRSPGRPRAFDRDKALEQAARTFWRLGFEGASIPDLTAAMGISAQSLYAAFTSKGSLYREAIVWYRAHPGAFLSRALEEKTAAAAFDRILHEAAHEYTRRDQPRGCMLSTATITCGVENDDIAAHDAAVRAQVRAAFKARIERGIHDGDVASSVDTSALARYIQIVVQGISVQAHDGASERDLHAAADIASADLIRQFAGA